MSLITGQRLQVLKVTGIGELIEIDDACRFRGDPVENKIRTDETSTAGDENGVFHKRLTTKFTNFHESLVRSKNHSFPLNASMLAKIDENTNSHLESPEIIQQLCAVLISEFLNSF